MGLDWITIFKNIKGEATAVEHRKYSKWYNSSRRHSEYADSLKRYEKSDGAFVPLSEAELAEKYRALLQSVQLVWVKNQTSRKSNRKFVVSTLAAACSVAAVAVFVYVGFFGNKTYDQQVVAEAHTDVNVPTLVTSQGGSVSLDESDDVLKTYNIDKLDGDKIACRNTPQGGVAPSSEPSFNTIIIPSCFTYTVVLDDGTQVKLNANSSLRYPVKFSGSKREVFLSGEAFFKVTTQSTPFVVSTKDADVKVYGTQFNINTDKNNLFETVLVSGSVGVSTKTGHKNVKQVKMTPNQRLVFSANSDKVEVDIVDTHSYLAWRDGAFVCDQERVSNLLDMVGRWYGVKFVFKNEADKNRIITMKTKNSISISNIISSIEQATKLIITKTSDNNYVVEPEE